MGNIDTLLNLDQSLRLRGLTKLSKAQLEVELANNQELQALRGQLSSDIGALTGNLGELTDDVSELNNKIEHQTKVHKEALSLQNQILENQIREIEKKQNQNFHKQRLFQCKEYINDYYKLSDTEVKDYFKTNFLNLLDELVQDSKNALFEIKDKEFALNLQTEISKICEDKTENIGVGLELIHYLNELFFKIEVEKKKINECNEAEKKHFNSKRQLEAKINNEKKEKALKEVIEIQATEKEKNRLNNLFILYTLLTVVFGLLFLSTFLTGVGFLALILMAFFLYQAIKINKQIKYKKQVKDNNSTIHSNSNQELMEVMKEVDSVKLELQVHINNLTLLNEESDGTLKKIFQMHPEFKIVDYVLGTSNKGTITIRDSLFSQAARLVVQNQMCSTSLIQRRMQLGYNRAGQLVEQLEKGGIVGPIIGSKPREVLFKGEDELEKYLTSRGIV